MKEQTIVIELQEDTVISATSATAGAHASLDYIPGATLLGAAAARLYRQLGSQAFEVFHGNAARFSDALPLIDDRPAWPVPLCWHEQKFSPARVDGRVVGKEVVNLAIGKRPERTQIKQLRDAHVDLATGRWVKPTLRLRMKTALEQGSAKESHLFGYEALPAGCRFVATIAARDNQLLDQLINVFSDGILIGRSRSAEYGRASVDIRDIPISTTRSDSGKFSFLYLASDLCLLDDHGQPCLSPEGRQLGLDRLALVPEKSFLRTRDYAPWNAYRRAHDMERQVIVRGSVLALAGTISEADVTRLEREGLGLYRNQGLGQVRINPAFVVDPGAAIQSRETASDFNRSSPPNPGSPLISLLQKRAGRRKDDARIAKLAERFRDQVRKVLDDAAMVGGVLDSESFGPSAAQWNKFRELQRLKIENKHDLLLAIFGRDRAMHEKRRDDETGIARPDHTNWKEPIWIGSEQMLVAEWFRRTITMKAESGDLSIETLRQLIVETAILMAREARQ